jgi:hypothetical protein
VRNALNTTMIRQYNSYAKILCEDFNDVRCWDFIQNPSVCITNLNTYRDKTSPLIFALIQMGDENNKYIDRDKTGQETEICFGVDQQ